MPSSRRDLIKAAIRAAAAQLSAAGLFKARAQSTRLVRTPVLQNVRGDRATILWATDVNGSASVQFSTDRSFSQTASAFTRAFPTSETGLSAPFFQHRVDIAGINPATDYSYRVVHDGQVLATGDSFRTAGPGPFTFLVFGDSGQDTPAQRQLARLMLQERSSLVLHAGDIAYDNGTFDQFQRQYFTYYRDLMRRVPFFTSPGNHEYGTNAAAPYMALNAPPTDGVPLEDRGRYYSFDWSNVHFIALDTNAPFDNAVRGAGSMLRWLENDLRNTRQTWKVVFFHHTPYPILQHQMDATSALVRQWIVPLLDKYSVDIVFNGHEHNYQQTKPLRAGEPVDAGFGTVYITTGGGGAALYPVVPHPVQVFADSKHHYMRARVEGDRMTVEAIGLDGQEIDRFELKARVALTGPSPQPSVDAVLNAASFGPGLAPGALVSIFGRNLAGREDQAVTLPLPAQFPGTTVTVNRSPVPLLYASPGQINAQLPFDATGRTVLSVTTPVGAFDAAVDISEAAPGIFSVDRDAAVVHADGAFVNASAPAQAGESLSIYLTGLGQVIGGIAAGQAAPAPPLTVRANVQVMLAGNSITPSFAGLAPGFAGLYQVNFEVPQGLPAGRHPLRVVAARAPSNTVMISVK